MITHNNLCDRLGDIHTDAVAAVKEILQGRGNHIDLSEYSIPLYKNEEGTYISALKIENNSVYAQLNESDAMWFLLSDVDQFDVYDVMRVVSDLEDLLAL